MDNRIPETLTYRGRTVQIVDSEQPTFLRELTGDWYLARCEPADRPCYWAISRTPFRTNMSREVRTSGWLGCSYGTDEYAHGTVRCSVATGRPLLRRTA